MTTTNFGAGVRLERDDPIATIVIDNPAKRNAVDRAVATALRKTLRDRCRETPAAP